MFSGIGGFELGINNAYDLGNQSANETSDPSVSDETVPLREPEALSQMPRSAGRERTSDEVGRGILPSDHRRERAVCIGFAEIDQYAINVYQRHFPEHHNYGDATTIIPEQLPDFDLLVGGFPCQAFSIAGKRAGFADTRGTLFFDITRILKEKRPRNFILENVKGLLSHDSGRTFKTIISALAELGYGVEWQVLNSKNFGVPQNRERVFIVGHLGTEGGQQIFPLGQNGGIHFEERSRPLPTLTTTDYKGPSKQRASIIVANPQIRRLTPIECERLQGFPDNWTAGISDTQRYKTLGNAVTVNVVQYVAEQLIKQA